MINSPYQNIQIKNIINGDITYLLTSSKISNIAYYISEVEDKLFVMDGYCVVDCKSFFSDFNQIIDNSFKSKNKSSKINELYKSGVLSKDEFEKAKKKILN